MRWYAFEKYIDTMHLENQISPSHRALLWYCGRNRLISTGLSVLFCSTIPVIRQNWESRMVRRLWPIRLWRRDHDVQNSNPSGGLNGWRSMCQAIGHLGEIGGLRRHD